MVGGDEERVREQWIGEVEKSIINNKYIEIKLKYVTHHRTSTNRLKF